MSFKDATDTCQACGRSSPNLRQYSSFTGLVADGRTPDGRVTVAPVFKHHRELCFSCFKQAVNLEKRSLQS